HSSWNAEVVRLRGSDGEAAARLSHLEVRLAAAEGQAKHFTAQSSRLADLHGQVQQQQQQQKQQQQQEQQQQQQQEQHQQQQLQQLQVPQQQKLQQLRLQLHQELDAQRQQLQLQETTVTACSKAEQELRSRTDELKKQFGGLQQQLDHQCTQLRARLDRHETSIAQQLTAGEVLPKLQQQLKETLLQQLSQVLSQQLEQQLKLQLEQQLQPQLQQQLQQQVQQHLEHHNATVTAAHEQLRTEASHREEQLGRQLQELRRLPSQLQQDLAQRLEHHEQAVARGHQSLREEAARREEHLTELQEAAQRLATTAIQRAHASSQEPAAAAGLASRLASVEQEITGLQRQEKERRQTRIARLEEEMGQSASPPQGRGALGEELSFALGEAMMSPEPRRLASSPPPAKGEATLVEGASLQRVCDELRIQVLSELSEVHKGAHQLSSRVSACEEGLGRLRHQVSGLGSEATRAAASAAAVARRLGSPSGQSGDGLNSSRPATPDWPFSAMLEDSLLDDNNSNNNNSNGNNNNNRNSNNNNKAASQSSAMPCLPSSNNNSNNISNNNNSNNHHSLPSSNNNNSFQPLPTPQNNNNNYNNSNINNSSNNDNNNNNPNNNSFLTSRASLIEAPTTSSSSSVNLRGVAGAPPPAMPTRPAPSSAALPAALPAAPGANGSEFALDGSPVASSLCGLGQMRLQAQRWLSEESPYKVAKKPLWEDESLESPPPSRSLGNASVMDFGDELLGGTGPMLRHAAQSLTPEGPQLPPWAESERARAPSNGCLVASPGLEEKRHPRPGSPVSYSFGAAGALRIPDLPSGSESPLSSSQVSSGSRFG
ncbi:unnamed protein product, partial [Polarella glacialis]